MTTIERAKLGNISVSQAVDLDAIESRVNSLDAAVVLRGDWDASAGSFPGSGTAQAGDSYIVTTAGTVNGVAFSQFDRIVAIADNASTSTYAANWLKLDYTDEVLSVAGRTGAVSLTSVDAIPSLTSTQRDAIVSPATSLVIWNSTNGRFEYWTGSAWRNIIELTNGTMFVSGTITTNGSVVALSTGALAFSARGGLRASADGAFSLRNNANNAYGTLEIATPTAAEHAATKAYVDGIGGGGSGREILSANRTYYVRTDGSDSNDGLADNSGGAFLTIQHALDIVFDAIDLAGYGCTIQVRDGTRTAPLSLVGKRAVGGIPTLQGNLTTPANCVLSITNEIGCLDLRRGAALYIGGFKVQTTTAGHGIHMSGGSYLGIVGLMDFGACAGGHIVSDHDSVLGIASNYNITGAAYYHWNVSNSSSLEAVQGPPAITITGTPAFAEAFAIVERGGIIEAAATFSGSATGKRFECRGEGIIESVNTLPGDAEGTFGDVKRDNAFLTTALTVGRESAVAVGGLTTRIHAVGTSTNTANTAASRYSADTSPPRLLLAKSRNATIASHTIVQSGDFTGEIAAFGSDGTTMQQNAGIRFSVDGTPGANDMPGRVDIVVAADGGIVLSNGITVRQNRAIEVPGIGTTGSAANAFLDSGSNNNLLRSTSSLAYKTDVEPVNPKIADAFLKAARPIWYHSLAPADKLDDGKDKSFYSFGAEDLAAIDPRLVNWGYQADAYDVVIDHTDDGIFERHVLKDGAKKMPDGVNDRAILAMLVNIAQRQAADIEALKADLYRDHSMPTDKSRAP